MIISHHISKLKGTKLSFKKFIRCWDPKVFLGFTRNGSVESGEKREMMRDGEENMEIKRELSVCSLYLEATLVSPFMNALRNVEFTTLSIILYNNNVEIIWVTLLFLN